MSFRVFLVIYNRKEQPKAVRALGRRRLRRLVRL